jgi:hypothetical protein
MDTKGILKTAAFEMCLRRRLVYSYQTFGETNIVSRSEVEKRRLIFAVAKL